MEDRDKDFDDVAFALDDGGAAVALHNPKISDIEELVNEIEANPATFARRFLIVVGTLDKIANHVQALPQREEFAALESKVSNLNAWLHV